MAEPSDAVRALVWQCKALKVPEPELEVRFHPERRFRFDACWRASKVALEVDGGVYTGGRHVRPGGVKGDCEKFSEAAAMGWRVLRVMPEHVESGQAINWVLRALAHAA